jgi:ABC-2 type transport system permease protein
MNTRRIFRIVRKDIAVGPRSPLLLFVVLMPLIMTLALQLVFGDLFAPRPSLAVLDQGVSKIGRLIEDRQGIEVVQAKDLAELKRMVADHEVDAGLVLADGFDQALREGRRPLLELYISGESYAVNRLVLSITTLDIIREVEGRTPPVRVVVNDLGSNDPIPIATRMTPLVAMFAFIMAGLFVPASSIVDERERKTITAVLTTPTSIGEFLCAKSALGVLFAFVMAVATLALNNALTGNLGALLLVLAVSAVFWSLLGLVVGLLAGNSQTLFAIVKGSGIFLAGPAIFYLFPDWPQWIAKVFPTFWAIDPLWRILADGATLTDILGSLVVVLGLIIGLILVVRLLAKRMLTKLASV